MTAFNPVELRLRPQDLVGKVAVVTGASKGIGRAILINLATRGCCVLATFSTPESLELVEDIARKVKSLHQESTTTCQSSKIVGLQADITCLRCPTIIADSLKKNFEGKLDILVNNAAITGGCHVGNTTTDFVHQKFLANVQTPIMLVDELVRRQMFRPESRIISISSDRARSPSNQSLVYSATKAALEAATRAWALQVGGVEKRFEFMAGTTANSVSVGATESEAIRRLPPKGREERIMTAVAGQIIAPGGKPHLGQCEDVADVVGILVSKEARWITGAIIPANGGNLMIQ